METRSYRADIDGLRAVAIALVVAYHAFPSLLPAGFVGVDVFFVISGYLISSIIFKGMERGDFRFTDFYGRRIRRIFPALLTVLSFCFVVGWIVLLPPEFMQLGKHILGGAGFVSNFILLAEVGYFDTSAQLKPLLHLWSLGIEEQFYIFWPLVTFLAYRFRIRFWLLIAAIALVSFWCNLHMVRTESAAAFYMPQSRAWELLVGALIASASRQGQSRLQGNVPSLLGAALIVASQFAIGSATTYPGWWALFPVIGAACLIVAGPNAWLNRKVLSSRPMTFLGLISFPLYLWHWPLLVFAKIVFTGPSPAARALIVVAAVALAWLTYRLVESPVRHGARLLFKTAVLSILMTSVAYAGLNSYDRNGLDFRAVARANRNVDIAIRWDYWTTPDCTRVYAVEPCMISGASPDTILLGDSHANHLYPGLVHAGGTQGVIDVGTCFPLDGVLMAIQKNQAQWPCTNRDTFAFEKRVIEENPSVRTAVISGWWDPVLAGSLHSADFQAQWGGWSLVAMRANESGDTRQDLLLKGLSRTITYLESKNIKAVFVMGTPYLDGDLNQYCGFGKRFGLLQDCSIPRTSLDEDRHQELSIVAQLKAWHPSLIVFDPAQYLCDSSRCYFSKHGQILYRDSNHLSVAGSDIIGKHLIAQLASLSTGN